jgi:hypothetical protein
MGFFAPNNFDAVTGRSCKGWVVRGGGVSTTTAMGGEVVFLLLLENKTLSTLLGVASADTLFASQKVFEDTDDDELDEVDCEDGIPFELSATLPSLLRLPAGINDTLCLLADLLLTILYMADASISERAASGIGG